MLTNIWTNKESKRETGLQGGNPRGLPTVVLFVYVLQRMGATEQGDRSGYPVPEGSSGPCL